MASASRKFYLHWALLLLVLNLASARQHPSRTECNTSAHSPRIAPLLPATGLQTAVSPGCTPWLPQDPPGGGDLRAKVTVG